MLAAASLLLSGAVAGLLGALLGVGGGVLVVPILHLGFGVDLPVAVGTSLVVITGTSIAGSAGYLRRGLVDLELALALAMGTLAGALAASWVAPFLPERVVAWLFSAVLVLTALNLLRKGRRGEGGAEAAMGGRRTAAFLLTPLAGGASGLLGIGGGLVQVPILRLLLGLEMRRAVAVSTLMVGWNTSVAAVVYLGRGEVDLPKVPWLLAGILGGALFAPAVGARLAQRSLEIGFALLLLYGAVRMMGS